MSGVISDPTADLLARIRNGLAAHKEEVVLADSKINFKLAKLLAAEGYLGEVKRTKSRPSQILISLQTTDKPLKPIKGLRKVSTPGRRVYVKASEIKPVRQGMGMAVVSTPQGLMSAHRAKARSLGGELICEVW